MKKLLSSVAILALMTSGVSAADNQIVTNAQINVDGYVGFDTTTVQGKTLAGTDDTADTVGLFVDHASNTINFGKTTVDTEFDGSSGTTETVSVAGGESTISRDIFVKSNAQNGVTMKLDNVDPMITDDGDANDEKITLTYKWNGTAIAANTEFEVLAPGDTDDGSTDKGDFTITAAKPLALQVAGEYTKSVAVTILVN